MEKQFNYYKVRIRHHPEGRRVSLWLPGRQCDACMILFPCWCTMSNHIQWYRTGASNHEDLSTLPAEKDTLGLHHYTSISFIFMGSNYKHFHGFQLHMYILQLTLLRSWILLVPAVCNFAEIAVIYVYSKCNTKVSEPPICIVNLNTVRQI